MTYQRLAIPGPTALPYEVLTAIERQPINHRGPEFAELLRKTERKLQLVFQTCHPIYILTCSGTGAMEAAVSNFTRPHDKVLALVNGAFGERFVKLCNRYGCDVERMDFDWGKPIRVLDVKDRLSLDKNREIKVVLFQLNETSTGVLNNAEGILKAVKRHGALSVVDAISGLAAVPFYQDLWGADIVLGASQKGLMAPPGLAFLSMSERARAELEELARDEEFYFSIALAEKYRKIGQTYATPDIMTMFALDAGLDLILGEGLEKCWGRHRRLAEMTRGYMRKNGLELLVGPGCFSPAVTAVKMPEWLSAAEVIEHLRVKYNTVIAGGQGELTGKIFRVAHLGHCDEEKVRDVCDRVYKTFCDLNCHNEG